MPLEFTPYAIPLIAGTALLFGVLQIVWQRRETPAARYLAWTYLAMGVYSLSYALELCSTSVKSVSFWLKVEYLGVPVMAPLLLMTVLAATEREHILTRRMLSLLFIIPAITIVLALTNNSHELIWRNMQIDRSNGFTGTLFDAGGWYWIHITYIYLLLTVTIIVLLHTYTHTTGLHNTQIMIMMLSMLAPAAAGLVFHLDLTPAHLDVTPYGFIFTGLGTAVGLLYFQLFDVTPIAHRAVIASLHDAVIIVDHVHRIVDINPAAAQLIEATNREVIGKYVDAVIPPPLDPLAGFIVTDTEHAEIELMLPDLHYFDVRNQTVTSRQKRVVGHVVVLRDITARRNAEAERVQLIEELDAFAHTVAHDLKNPLTVITGFSDVILENAGDNIPQEITEAVKMIQDNGFKMSSIIQELLLLSGVRQVSTVMCQPIDTAPLISGAWARLFTLVKDYNARLTLPNQWPTAVGYAPWIEEVWTNYLSNAIKYGGTPPLITVGADELPDGMVRFWVRDNGAGLSPEQQATLFVPFTRLRQQHIEGHGLGLSITHRIIKKHGGTVGVESTPGEGSLFYFTLAAQQDPPATSPD